MSAPERGRIELGKGNVSASAESSPILCLADVAKESELTKQ